MAFLIPETLRTRRDVPPGVNRLARALQESMDDSATVWYEPLFDREGERPDVVLLMPDLGILVLEVVESKAGAVRGITEGRLHVERAGTTTAVAHPLLRAEDFAAQLRAKVERSPHLVPTEHLPVAAAGVFPYLSERRHRSGD